MPSEKTLAAKQTLVAELADELKGAATLVIADHRGLTVSQDTELRAALRKAGITYKVVKNTMLLRAAEEAGIENMEELFKGPSAIAFSDDPIAPAKVMKEYADKFDKLELKGGATNGIRSDLDAIKALASIPPIEVLYAQVVGGIASPLTGLALIVDAIRKKVEEEGKETAAEVVAAAGTAGETAEAETPEA